MTPNPISKIATFAATAATAVVLSQSAVAIDFKPAIIYDAGGKNDKSFNEAVFRGMQKFTAETGIEVMEFEVSNESQRVQAMKRMVSRGASLVIATGFSQADAIAAVAGDNPTVQFAIIDVDWLDLPNLRQYTFKEHEGSYLVGVAAAKASKTKKAGFVGGMDIPLISKFACGYKQGFLAAGGKEVYENMTGTTPAAWSNPAKGAELARTQFDRGADVVYAAAGLTGLGVLLAAADEGKLAIGVDSNQNYLHPGTVLTSMLKRVDVAAYDTLIDAMNGNFTADIKQLGLAEGGVDWAVDQYNEKLVAGFQAEVEQARQDIVTGKIKVHNYASDNKCPY